MKSFTQQLLEAEKKSYWASTQGKGQKGEAFLKLSDDPFMKLILGMLQGIIDERTQEQKMLRATLKTLGITPADNNTNLYILCQSMLQSIIVPTNKETFGYEINSLSGYIEKVIKLDGVLTEMPEHPTFMHKVNDEWVFDENKYNEMLTAVL